MGLLGGCGYQSKDAELIGQVKKVSLRTPLICPNYYAVDISLGVMRNGVGSMSHEDVELFVSSESDVAMLRAANESGKIVKVKYDVLRLVICKFTDHELTKVEVVP